MSDNSPANTVPQTILARVFAFSPGHASLGPATKILHLTFCLSKNLGVFSLSRDTKYKWNYILMRFISQVINVDNFITPFF